jgi:pilus assembly protein Flp/PilA
MLKRFMKDETGATAIEYGLICALIFLTILAGITALTNGADSMYGRIDTNVNGALDK